MPRPWPLDQAILCFGGLRCVAVTTVGSGGSVLAVACKPGRGACILGHVPVCPEALAAGSKRHVLGCVGGPGRCRRGVWLTRVRVVIAQ